MMFWLVYKLMRKAARSLVQFHEGVGYMDNYMKFVNVVAVLCTLMLGAEVYGRSHADTSHEHHMHSSEDRSNTGGKLRGRERARWVQEHNKRADEQRGFDVAPNEPSKPE